MDGGRRPGRAVGDEDRASESTRKVDVQLWPAPPDRELQHRDQLVECGIASVCLPVLGSRILDPEGSIGRFKLSRCFSATAHRLNSGSTRSIDTATSSRTRGTTFLPYRSMFFCTDSGDRPGMPNFRWKRMAPRSFRAAPVF